MLCFRAHCAVSIPAEVLVADQRDELAVLEVFVGHPQPEAQIKADPAERRCRFGAPLKRRRMVKRPVRPSAAEHQIAGILVGCRVCRATLCGDR